MRWCVEIQHRTRTRPTRLGNTAGLRVPVLHPTLIHAFHHVQLHSRGRELIPIVEIVFKRLEKVEIGVLVIDLFEDSGGHVIKVGMSEC